MKAKLSDICKDMDRLSHSMMHESFIEQWDKSVKEVFIVYMH